MPWRKFAEKWTEALTQTRDAHLETVDPTERALVVRLERPVPKDQPVRLTFPCGSTVASTPLWQREKSLDSQETLAAFCLKDDPQSRWSEIEDAKDSATRGSPRVRMRLWVSFPSDRFQGTVTHDLSLEGCRLKGDFLAACGETIELFLDLPDAVDPLRLKAKVVWANGTEAGLRFLNLHACDEVRLLRTLGRTATPPSYFLPGLELTAPSFVYEVSETDKGQELLLSVANWDVRFSFQHVETFGPERGAFQRIEILSSSEAITKMRSKLKVSLAERQKLVHLRLFDDQDRLLFELTGKETGFQRSRRRSPSDPIREVA